MVIVVANAKVVLPELLHSASHMIINAHYLLRSYNDSGSATSPSDSSANNCLDLHLFPLSVFSPFLYTLLLLLVLLPLVQFYFYFS